MTAFDTCPILPLTNCPVIRMMSHELTSLPEGSSPTVGSRPTAYPDGEVSTRTPTLDTQAGGDPGAGNGRASEASATSHSGPVAVSSEAQSAIQRSIWSTRHEEHRRLQSKGFYDDHGYMRSQAVYFRPETVRNLPTKAELAIGQALVDVLTTLQWTADSLEVVAHDQMSVLFFQDERNPRAREVSRMWSFAKSSLETEFEASLKQVEIDIDERIATERRMEESKLQVGIIVQSRTPSGGLHPGSGSSTRSVILDLLYAGIKDADMRAARKLLKLSADQAQRLSRFREASILALNAGDGRDEDTARTYDPQGGKRGYAGLSRRRNRHGRSAISVEAFTENEHELWLRDSVVSAAIRNGWGSVDEPDVDWRGFAW